MLLLLRNLILCIILIPIMTLFLLGMIYSIGEISNIISRIPKHWSPSVSKKKR